MAQDAWRTDDHSLFHSSFADLSLKSQNIHFPSFPFPSSTSPSFSSAELSSSEDSYSSEGEEDTCSIFSDFDSHHLLPSLVNSTSFSSQYSRNSYTLTRLNSHHIVMKSDQMTSFFHLTHTLSSTTLFSPVELFDSHFIPTYRSISYADSRTIVFSQGLIQSLKNSTTLNSSPRNRSGTQFIETLISPKIFIHQNENNSICQFTLQSGVYIVCKQIKRYADLIRPKRSISIRSKKQNFNHSMKSFNVTAIIRPDNDKDITKEFTIGTFIGHTQEYAALIIEEQRLYKILYELNQHQLIRNKVYPLHSVFEDDDDLTHKERDQINQNCASSIAIARSVLIGLAGIWGAQISR